MIRSVHHRKPFSFAILAGLLVGLLSMVLFVASAWAAPQVAPPIQTDATPAPAASDCASCHPDVQDSWMGSPHAHAYDDAEFIERWKSLGEPGECLLCHTTGYQATTGEFTAEGVTCEACHGEPVEGHPPAIMPVQSDTEYCGTCHLITLGEWRLTGHAAADVGCTDCHNPHSQAARFENPDEMCINCHKDDLTEHQNDTHIQKGISCIECHALVIPPETPPADGLAPTGHSFTISAVTCVACHTDTLHIGKPIPAYQAGALSSVGVTSTVTSTLPTVVAEYTGSGGIEAIQAGQQIQALEAALASSRLSTLFQGGLIGLALGATTVFLVTRNERLRIKESTNPKAADDSAGDTDDTEQDDE